MSAFKRENNHLQCKMTQHNCSMVRVSCDSRDNFYLFLVKHTGFQMLIWPLFCGSNGKRCLGCSWAWGLHAADSGYHAPVECSWGEQTARALPYTEQAVWIHPQDVSRKALLPSLTSYTKKRQASGQCVSFSICQSPKVYSIYIACFFFS